MKYLLVIGDGMADNPVPALGGKTPLEAAKIPAGAEGVVFLPYMAGERSPIWDPDAKGVFYGLSYDKTRAHMIRAVLGVVGVVYVKPPPPLTL